MQSLGQEGPKIPIAICRAHTCARVALDGVVEVGKFQRITQEEYGSIIAHQVPIARIGIKLHRKTTNISLGIGGTTLTRNGREADNTLGLLAHLGKY